VADDEDRERALVVAGTPADPPKVALAESIAGHRKGELIALDQRGELISRSRARRKMIALYAATTALLVASAVVSGATSLIFPLAIGGAAGSLVHLLSRKLRRAMALMAAWRNDEARATLLDIRSRRGVVGVEVERMLGLLAWRKGDLVEALAHVDRAIALLGAKRNVRYWLCLVARVELLIELDLDRAIPLVPALDQLPKAEYFINERRYVALQIAFRTDAPDTLPADDELFDWAKSALADNNGGFRIGLLAWAFDRRGDREMADHLLREVKSHLQMPFADMEPIAPRLYAWLVSQAERSVSDED
jgi:hypothetical protein